MSTSSREGRPLKTFRLSDVPPEVRQKAAQKIINLIARQGDPLAAVFETLKIEAVASDPELAATTMPAECKNSIHVVALDEWERAINPRRRRA